MADTGRISRRASLAGLGSAALLGFGTARAEETLPASPHTLVQHPSFAAATDLLRRREWAALAASVAALPPQSAYELLNELGGTTPHGVDFAGLDAHRMGATIAGAIAVGWAWRFRGSGDSSSVTERGWRGFEKELLDARAHFDSAARADSNDGVAHAFAIRAARGLSDRRSLARALHSYLVATRRPVSGLSAYMVSVSAKWLGSEEECLEFARGMWRSDLPASAALLPDAHWVCMHSRAMDDAATESASYFSAEAVRAEILAARTRFEAAPPADDVFARVYANGVFSFVLVQMNEPELARKHLIAMSPYVGGPWMELENPRVALQGVRDALGLAAP